MSIRKVSAQNDSRWMDFRAWIYSTALARILIVTAVFAMAILAGWAPNILFLAIPAVIVGIILLVRWPQVGFVLLIIATLAVPFSLSTGTESRVHAGMLVLIALLALWILEGVIRRTLRIENHPTTLPLMVFLIVAVLAFLAGQLTWFPKVAPASLASQLGGLSLFFFLPQRSGWPLFAFGACNG